MILSRKAHGIALWVMIGFFLVTSFAWCLLLSWMSLNGIEGSDALNKLETFIAGNFGLIMGTLLRSR